MKNVAIKAFGSCIPEKTVSNQDLAEIVETSDEWIFSRTGIKKRHISENENTSDICAKAALDILEKANFSPLDVEMIIVATCSPDYTIPSTACLVQSKIGAKNALAFDIAAACSGFVYGLSIGEKFIRSGQYNNVLIIGGEVLSKFTDWQDRSTCVLFGDGAAGALLVSSERESFLGEALHSDGDKGMCLTAGFIPFENPYSEKILRNPKIEMDGRSIWDFTIKKVPENILEVLNKTGTSLDEIDWFIPHQANSRIVEAISKKLKVNLSKFYMNIEEYANTSAGTIPIALWDMEQKGLIEIGSGKKILLIGFGGGLTWGSLLIQL